MSINLSHGIKPISYIKKNAAAIMKYLADHKNPIIITQNGVAKAALIDIESYQEMKDTFSLLKIIRLAERDIDNSQVKPAIQVMTEIKQKYRINK